MILVAFLAFLFPLAVYCLILAHLNRRRHPVMVPGTWDFGGVLFAASGFLLVGGPCILRGFKQLGRDYWLFSHSTRLHALSEERGYWLALWALYFVGVLGVAVFVLWRRRRVTSIYNVGPAAFDEALARALDRLGLSWGRSADRVVIGFRGVGDNGALSQGEAVQAPHGSHVAVGPLPPRLEEVPGPQPLARGRAGLYPDLLGEEFVLRVDSFRLMRHVTLRWPADLGSPRKVIEGELAGDLAEVRTGDNPAGVWFLSIAAGLFSLMFFDLLLFILRLWHDLF